MQFNIIKYKRMLKGITQQELANLCNCRRETINQIENFKRIPNVKIIIKLMEVLEISFDEIIRNLY